MRQLLVSGVGFTPGKVIEPARLLPAAGVLLVYGRHVRSELAEDDVRYALADRWVRSVPVEDWDLSAMGDAIAPAVDSAVEALGGPREVRPVVNLTAGHGLLHACLAEHARREGLEMVFWHEDRAGLVRSCPFRLGSRKLSPVARRVLDQARQGLPAEALPAALGMAASSAYAALAVLQRAGLVRRQGDGYVAVRQELPPLVRRRQGPAVRAAPI